MTKDFYFNTAEAMDKAKADRDKPVTPVEYKPVIYNVGADSNMLWPDTPFVPKGTGKITLLESKPNTWVMRITADRRIEVNEDVEVTEAAQKVLDAMRCLLAALPAPVQEPVAWVCEGFSSDEKHAIDYWQGDVDDLPIGTQLYTIPPGGRQSEDCLTAAKRQSARSAWVGLTDEEIEQGCKESWVTEQAWQSAVWWAEAKLKEKNT
jgi:hypothetical protein